MSNKKLVVIFDFDGTLADTIGLLLQVYNEHAHAFSADTVQMSEFTALRKMGYRRALKAKRLKWHHLPKLVAFIRKEMRQHMGEVKPYAGIVALLENLKDREVAIGVLTSNDLALVQEFFVAHQFPAFDFVVSERTIFGKEKALARILTRHGLDRQNVVYVGDEPRDVVASKKAGVTSVGVTWGLGGREMLESSYPDYLVDTVEELVSVLKKL